MTRVNSIELFFYGQFRLLLIEQKSLRHCLHETMSTSWKLRRKKFDCDNCSWWKTRKTKRTCWQVWIFIALTRWLSTMMRKDFRLSFSVFIFSTICLESGNAEFVFPKKFIRRFRKLFSTTLYLFFRGWWQIFVLLNACSQLLEVIFLLVQAEAQYNSVTINNISTVGVVKWGSSIFVLWCRKPWRASVTIWENHRHHL